MESNSVRDRFSTALKQRADGVKSVFNEVYTLKYWQIGLNLLGGIAGIALMAISMISTNPVVIAATLVPGLIVIAVVFIYNILIRTLKPVSFMQYTVIDGGVRHEFRVIGKTRASYRCADKYITVDRDSYTEEEKPYLPQCAFDFFAHMIPDVRVGKANTETYKGRLDVGGKTVKCKIVFKNGELSLGIVGGIRIKYFDVNDRNFVFTVPQKLRIAAEKCGVGWKKNLGVRVEELN